MSPRTLSSTTSRRTFIKSSLAVAAVVPLASRMAWAAERKVNIYNFDTYIGTTTLETFSSATGIATRYDLYADNAELFARLREGNPGYDVICPTNDTVERMIAADMLVPLDHAKVPNLKNLEPRFLEASYDAGRKFSATYFWGTVGVGYYDEAVKAALGETALDSWKYIYGEESAKFAGKIAWNSDAPVLIGCALKLLGHSLNASDDAALKQVEELLTTNKKNVRTITGDNGQDLLLGREVDLAVDYNGDIKQVSTEEPGIKYVVPKEGVQLWEDSWCIPKGAPNVAEAHEFINYILDAKVHAEIAGTVGYALPNAEAKKLMPADYLSDTIIFPSEEAVKASEYAKYQSEEISQKYTDIITRVRAA
jgi:spermidine/putrescine transport system substrate-binding protein